MKILFINTGPWGTGSFTVIHSLTDVFLKDHHQVKVFFPDNKLPTLEERLKYNDQRYITWKFPIEKNSVKIASFPLMVPDPNPRSREDPILFSKLTQKQLQLYFKSLKNTLQSVIDTFKPDIIDTQHIWSNGYAIHELGHPYFVTAHNSDQMAFLHDERMQPYAKAIAKNALSIFCATEYLKEKVCNLYQIDPSKIYITPNGYDQEIFYPYTVDKHQLLNRLSVKIPSNATIVTCIGKVSKTKGIDILLKANQYLSDNDNIHFILFGAGNVDQFVKDNQLPISCLKNMHFVGHQTSKIIAQANNIAKLSVLPSRNEGFPLAILEAMGCGLPMVVSDCCGLDKLAVGESFPIMHPEMLAKAIKKIIKLPKLAYQKLSKEAIKKATQYQWKKIAERRLAIYKKFL